jgi:hypothetical protein
VRAILSTPQKARSLSIFCFLLVLSQPLFSFAFYCCNELNGVYPGNADSIMIPIFFEFMAWVIWAPIVLVFLRRTVLKNYPGAIPLGTWNRERRLWSALWTILFMALLIIPLSNVRFDVSVRNPFELLDTCLWAWLYLNLRAVIVARPDVMLINRSGRLRHVDCISR